MRKKGRQARNNSTVIEGLDMQLLIAVGYGCSGSYALDKDGVPLFNRYKSPFSLHIGSGNDDAVRFSYRFVIKDNAELYEAIYTGRKEADLCDINNYLKGDLLTGNWKLIEANAHILQSLQSYQEQLKDLSMQLFQFINTTQVQ